jgi:polysaccharide biosynthesis protein PelD
LGDALLPVTTVATDDPATKGSHALRSLGSAVNRAAAARFPVLPPPAALVEIAVLFGLIIGLAWLTGQDLGDLRPHPFWVPVLLLSLQYGTVSGLLAAGIATAFTAFGQLPEQIVGETYFVYFLRIWIEPILWISSAVLLGQFRMRQIANKMELVRQVEELAAQRASLAEYSVKLRHRCEALERRLAGRQEPDALLMLQAISQARQAGAPGLGAAFSHVMAAVLPGSRASLFVLDHDPSRGTGAKQLRRVLIASPTGGGAHADESAASGLDAAHPLYQCIALRGEGVSVLTAAGEAKLAGQGLMAVPIRSEHGAVIGMIKVESLDSHLLGASSLAALDAAAMALAGPLQALLVHHIATALSVGPVLGTAAATQQSGASAWRHVAKRLPAGIMGR